MIRCTNGGLCKRTGRRRVDSVQQDCNTDSVAGESKLLGQGGTGGVPTSRYRYGEGR